MLTKFTACPMASFILILVVTTIILDTYVYFGLLVLPTHPVFLAALFIIITIYAVFTIWLANRTCYNFVWLSWLIVIYLVYSIIFSIVTIINPEQQKQLQREVDAIVDEPVDSPKTQ
jgi:hypothetical protein